MSARDNQAMEEAAIDWVLRTRDSAFADWEGFTAWLEADPAHAELYDRLSLTDEAIAGALAARPSRRQAPAIEETGRRSPRRWWIGGAAAASVAAAGALLLTVVDRNPFPRQDYLTAPGEHRTVQLADGSRIELNGETHVVVDGPRHARLERGEALFTIVHDSSRPFELASGGAVVRDLGTVFDVVRSERRFSVTVSEGAIVFNPDGEGVRVPAGRSLEQEGGRLAVREVVPEQVGGWREGRLVYEGATMARVAEDLGRTLGLAVETEPGLASRRFSGIIQIEGKGEAGLRGAAATLGVDVRRAGAGWRLTGP